MVLVSVDPQGKAKSLVGEDADYDIAVVKTEASDCAYLSVANEALPKTNERAALVSAQDVKAPSCSTGVVASVMSLPGLFAAITTTIPVQAGQSGSPLLNAAGEVIGVVPYASPSQSATASPIESIRRIIVRANGQTPGTFSKRPSTGSNLPLLFDADFSLGVNAFGRSDWREAEDHFKKVGKRLPESVLTLTFLALVQMRSGNIDKAESNAERALRLRPDSAMPYLVKGVCLVTRKRSSEGLKMLRKALEIGLADNDTAISAWELVARVAADLGHPNEAEAALVNLQRLDPKRATELRSQLESLTVNKK